MIIGTLKQHTDTTTGEVTMRGGISFAGVDLDICARAAGAKAPFRLKFEVFEVPGGKHARGNQGAIWANTKRDGTPYESISIESTRLPEPLSCLLTEADETGERAIVWNRPQRREGGQ